MPLPCVTRSVKPHRVHILSSRQPYALRTLRTRATIHCHANHIPRDCTVRPFRHEVSCRPCIPSAPDVLSLPCQLNFTRLPCVRILLSSFACALVITDVLNAFLANAPCAFSFIHPTSMRPSTFSALVRTGDVLSCIWVHVGFRLLALASLARTQARLVGTVCRGPARQRSPYCLFFVLVVVVFVVMVVVLSRGFRSSFFCPLSSLSQSPTRPRLIK